MGQQKAIVGTIKAINKQITEQKDEEACVKYWHETQNRSSETTIQSTSSLQPVWQRDITLRLIWQSNDDATTCV